MVFTDGLIQAFSEKRIRASVVSSETGTGMNIERQDNIVTVIDATKLEAMITESRPAMYLELCCFSAMREDETLHMTCMYNTTIQAKVSTLNRAYVTENGRDNDLPSKTQAEFTISLLVTVIDRIGRRQEHKMQSSRADIDCVKVNPYL